MSLKDADGNTSPKALFLLEAKDDLTQNKIKDSDAIDYKKIDESLDNKLTELAKDVNKNYTSRVFTVEQLFELSLADGIDKIHIILYNFNRISRRILMINSNDFKTGVTIEWEGNIYEVLEFQHVKPGKGGAFVQTKLKNLRTGANISYTFNAGIKIETAEIKKVEMQYIYDNEDKAVFMDNETYEQIEIPKDTIKDELQYLTVEKNAQVRFYGDEVLGIVLPDKVVLEVTNTPPGEKGNSATNTMKSAILETGIEIRVPMFINNGDKIIVNTVTGKYDTRYKE